MMDDFGILRALFKEEVLASVNDEENDGKSIILEEQQGHQSYRLTITGAPYDTVAFKADAFPAPTRIFRDSKGECKRASPW